MEVDIKSGVHQRVFDIHVFGCQGLSVGTHDHFVAVCVDMALAKRHWLREHIVTGTDKVHEKNLVVLDEAENPLVEVSCALWTKRDDDALGSIRFHNAFGH